MARFNALRDALEEDPFLGGGPTGDAEAETTVIDYGDTTMARASGLRARPPVAADWREKEAERLARERLDAERLVPSTDMLSRVAERSRDPSMRLIPVANAPSGSDVATATASALPSVTADKPAGKPDSSDKAGMVAPSSEGAGGDSSERDLYLARLAAQNAAGFGGMGAGKNIDMGIADTLGERLKQVQALRAKREEQSLEQQRERATWGTSNRATLASFLAQYKDKPEVVEALKALEPAADTSKQSDFLKNVVGALTTPPKVAGIQAATKKTGAQGDVAAATAVAVPAKVDIAKGKLAEDIRRNKAGEAIRWAALNRASAQAASKLTEGKPDVFRKEVNDKTQVLGTSIAKEYGEITSALEEADRALVAARGVPPDTFARVVQATKVDSLNTPEERALFRSVGELRRAAQKAQSGLAVTEAERQEFLLAFGQDWLQNPSTLLEAIEWMRRKTRDKLDKSLATYRAQGDVGNTALRAYEQANGITPNAEYLKPFSERAPKTATAPVPAPAAQGGGAPAAGTVTIKRNSDGKTKTVPAADKAKWLANPDFEEVK